MTLLQPEWMERSSALLNDLDKMMVKAAVLPLNNEQLEVLIVGVGLALQMQFLNAKTGEVQPPPVIPPEPTPIDQTELLAWLARNDFRPCDSGASAASGLPVPFVHLLVPPSKLVKEANRLADLLKERGIDLTPLDDTQKSAHMQASYTPGAKMGTLSLFNVK
jgi:hypothetical protein